MSLQSRVRRARKALPLVAYQQIHSDLCRLSLAPRHDDHYIAARLSGTYAEHVCATCRKPFPVGEDHSPTRCPVCVDRFYREMMRDWDPDRARREVEEQLEAVYATAPPPDPEWEIAQERRLEREAVMMVAITADPMGWRPTLDFPEGPLVFDDIAEKGRLLPKAHCILVKATDVPFGVYHDPVVVPDSEIADYRNRGYRVLTAAEHHRVFGDPDEPTGTDDTIWDNLDGDPLPRTRTEFDAAFPSHKHDDPASGQLYAWAATAGAVYRCEVGGELCIDGDSFASALADAWQEIRESAGEPSDDARWSADHEHVQARLVNTDVDLGGWNYPRMCNYHDAQETKDRQRNG